MVPYFRKASICRDGSCPHDFQGSEDRWLVANERAYKTGVRFTEADLNRSAPGNSLSPIYEVRRAYEIMQIAARYRFVIDIHGTTASTGIFVIVTNPTPANIALAASIPIANVVIWAAKSSAHAGPLSQFVNCGVEIECGPKTSRRIREELRDVLWAISWGKNDALAPTQTKQTWYRVYGSIPRRKRCRTPKLKDFEQATVDYETFYPLLVGQYKTELCYKMELVNFNDILAY